MKSLKSIENMLRQINSQINNGNVYDVTIPESYGVMYVSVYNKDDGTIKRFGISYYEVVVNPKRVYEKVLDFVQDHETFYNSPLGQALR